MKTSHDSMHIRRICPPLPSFHLHAGLLPREVARVGERDAGDGGSKWTHGGNHVPCYFYLICSGVVEEEVTSQFANAQKYSCPRGVTL